jgi:hypothetical protein
MIKRYKILASLFFALMPERCPLVHMYETKRCPLHYALIRVRGNRK